ncbi:PQQ-dependent sugar dehydrogenase [Cyanobium sp. ATX 6A2]|uniref:PQQ-dependent sugar dehydrogenase n=1 Tax=Cyanobium sp. ATX 6A2 TaxID=2823700 RepID=UPI0020CE34B6|nr:PQQ-dependent sugar dehydrogenase [Cyanobium sp. ATX 6A2]MCP9886461.1 PQQ-dependent sugar dehydrogenase [Cyanobium sp. ATX 6A2]
MTPTALALFTAMLLAGGCARADAPADAPKADAPAAAPIEAVDPAQAPEASGFRQTVLVRGLEHPWGLAWLPNGDLLISERPGRLRIVRGGVLDPVPVAGVPEVLVSGQGGLLDVALHPRFAENRLVYLTYAAGTPEANHTRLARARFDGRALSQLEVLYAVPQRKSGTQHFGSRLLWLPDDTLLLAIGDGGNPPLRLEGDLIREQAQNRGSALGKILRLSADGTPAPDNPFQGDGGALPELWSLGHRNIQGLAYDPLQDRVWASEHGARGGDELNLVSAGGNHGWPLVTHSREYFGPEITPRRSAPEMVDPRRVWTPAIAPSGLAVASGRVPQWRGDLFAGGLVSGDVRRLRIDGEGRVTAEERIPIGQRVRDVREGPDGFLYVLTDDARDGRLIRLEPG